LIRKVKPDIIVGSTPKAALLSMLAARWNNISARIYHVRGFRAEGLSGVPKLISVFAEKLTIAIAAEVLCDSVSLRNALINSGCLGKHRGIVLGAGSCCGVDTEFFRPPTVEERHEARERMGINAGETIIGFIGRITKDKGVSELVQAISSVNETCGDARLILVGPDEGGIDYLGDLLQNGPVTYMGPTTDVRSAYWAFDVFALPSYREGFPISPLEAQSCGLPSVTTMATGCIDSQPPSNSQLTVPTKDPDSLATAIKFLVASPDKRSSMGKNARQWVLENFKSSDVVQRQVAFLELQISKQNNSNP